MIPNIIKGSGITGAIRYNMGEGNDKETRQRKELLPGETSRSEILGGQNFGFEIDSAERVELARRMMEFNGMAENQAGRTRKCEKDCLHLSLSWESGQNPSRAEMIEAAQSALKALGMEKAQAVYFAHHDTPQPHVHIVASRINPETGMTFSDTRDQTKAQAWSLRWEREHDQITPARRELHALVDTALARDGAGLVERLTARESTFEKRDVERAIAYAEIEGKEARAFRDKVLADRSVIGLRETADGPIERYTTRDILKAERGLQADVRALAGDARHAVSLDAQREAAIKHGLNAEQADALSRSTGPEGFAMIAGQAGTGKSRAMGAIRDAYEAAGYKVIGTAWTNGVVEDLRAKGFSHAATLSSELGLHRPEGAGPAPAAAWHDKTAVLVDEAGMLSTRNLAALTAQARASGAKLILVGDEKQLGSIEHGGMFGPLRQEHGAAQINEVQRVTKQSERDAWNLMHKGEFGPAMQHFEREGALHWQKTEAQAEAGLVQQYAKDAQAAPGKSRFIFAHTNEQVDRLNAMARGEARAAGRLGEDHRIETARGVESFATGDRLQFTGNGKSRKGKEAGFVNGATGTISAISEKDGQSHIALTLDSGKELKFTVGTGKNEFNDFRHGYAGTIYKGQGKTIDQTYVLVSKGWKAEASYVAMTRHKESVAVFIPETVAADRAALADLMARKDGRHAASAYTVDPVSLARSGLVQEEMTRPVSPRAAREAPRPGGADRQTSSPAATAARGAKAAAAAPGRAEAPAQKPAEKASARSAGGGRAAGAMFDGIGKAAGSVIEGLANLFSPSAPEPKDKAQDKPPEAAPVQEPEPDSVKLAFEARERETARRQAVIDLQVSLFPPERDADRLRERDEDRDKGRERGR